MGLGNRLGGREESRAGGEDRPRLFDLYVGLQSWDVQLSAIGVPDVRAEFLAHEDARGDVVESLAHAEHAPESLSHHPRPLHDKRAGTPLSSGHIQSEPRDRLAIADEVVPLDGSGGNPVEMPSVQLNAGADSSNEHFFKVRESHATCDDLPFPRQRDTNAPQRGPERIVAGAIHGIEQPLPLHRGLGVPELFPPNGRVVQSGEPKTKKRLHFAVAVGDHAAVGLELLRHPGSSQPAQPSGVGRDLRKFVEEAPIGHDADYGTPCNRR